MQTVLPFTAPCYSSRYFPTAANEPEVSHIHKKTDKLTSALKNKVDTSVKISCKLMLVLASTKRYTLLQILFLCHFALQVPFQTT